MLGMIEEFRPLFEARGVELTPAKVVQVLSQDELCDLLPQFDGWIIGDDPATRRVFAAGKAAVLLMHGGNSSEAPPTRCNSLRAALCPCAAASANKPAA